MLRDPVLTLEQFIINVNVEIGNTHSLLQSCAYIGMVSFSVIDFRGYLPYPHTKVFATSGT